jgi:hypothetical protein
VDIDTVIQVGVINDNLAALDAAVFVQLVAGNTLATLEHEKVTLGVDDDPSGSAEVAQNRRSTPACSYSVRVDRGRSARASSVDAGSKAEKNERPS